MTSSHLSSQSPIVTPTPAMKQPRVRQIYSSFNAKQTRTILKSLSVESPARLPNARSIWLCQFPNVHALIWGCISIAVSQTERVNNKPRYQIEVERFAAFNEPAAVLDLTEPSSAE